MSRTRTIAGGEQGNGKKGDPLLANYAGARLAVGLSVVLWVGKRY
jgi:hypothetical protein